MRSACVCLFFCFVAVARADQFPCEINDYRVTSTTEVWFHCTAPPRSTVTATVRIFELNALGFPSTSLTGNLVFDPSVERSWQRVSITPPGSLMSARTYRLVMDSVTTITPPIGSGKIKPLAYTFNTKPDTPIATDTHCPGQKCLIGSSKIALTGSAATTVGINEPACNSLGPLTAFQDLQLRPGIRSQGQFRLRYPPSVMFEDDMPLCAANLTNVFGVPVKLKSAVKAEAAPKDKASSQAYAKLLSQAGPGAKPGWAADVKLAPNLFSVGSGFFFSPEALVDIGFGKVADTKSTDTAKFGVGVTRAFISKTPRAVLQGGYLSPRVAFETDRKGHHQNLLFDLDYQLYIKGALKSRETAANIAYARAVLDAQAHDEDPPQRSSIRKNDFGWQLQTSIGLETGGALSADDTKSSDEATSVNRPTYSISRIRPKVSATLEYKRADVTVVVIPRYLFTAEQVTRENTIPDPKAATKTIQSIYVKEARGFRPYGEVSLNFSIDPVGHVALSSTYKLGSVPPNFDYVSTVQSGVLLRF